MTRSIGTASRSLWPVYLVLALLLAVTLVFVIAFVVETETEIAGPVTPASLVSDSYATEVAALLPSASPERGALLIEQKGCAACHRLAAGRIAPSFAGIAERAALREPPLTAFNYLYQSITSPMAYVVDGYTPAMPQDFYERLTPAELGDVIAYLLSGQAA